MTNAISAEGLALIQRHEGFRAEPAQLPDGNWVVGFSHVRIGDAGAALSEGEAADLLLMDIAPTERLVNARVTQSISQSQFDALVSFAFSVGAEAFEQSQVLRRVNAGDFVAAACAMDAWRKSDVGGELEVVDALVGRRAAEKALFLKDMTLEAAPSVFVRAKLDHAAAILGAPVKYAAAPVVGSIPVVQAKPEPVARLVEILKSEPQTEALLLTQVVPDDVVEDGELVTAHAKPVARSLDDVREATRRSYTASQAEEGAPKQRLPWFNRNTSNKIEVAMPKPNVDHRLRKSRRSGQSAFRLPEFDLVGSFENTGLFALLAFGLALLALGGSLLFSGTGDMIELVAGGAVAAPGVAAVLMALLGLRRPQARAA
jgi:lysozyme